VVESKSTNTTVSSTRALRLEQNLWDGGRTSARIREAEANISVNEARIYIQNQTLSMQIVNAWQNLLSADGRIQVARDTLDQLDKYRQQMTRRVTADVSPPIDLELVQSRILQTEVELTQARNARQIALGKLEQYSGVEGLSRLQQRAPVAPGLAQTEQAANQLAALDWFDVASQHPDVHKARKDAQVAQQRIDAKRAEQWPQVYLRLDQPIGSTNNDLTGFVGLRYTPGAGLATGVEAQALASRAASLEQTVDTAMRNVLEAMYADRDELSTSRIRMLALDKSVQGSRNVLESYGRQFTAGRKTWQDLMNAVRELAQNQYNLVDAHAGMVSAMYRLQIRTGQSPQPVE
jgi:adhesin transport system outer membrane protein